MNIFVTGTDTEVGKTIISAGIAAVLQSLGFTVAVFKPIQTGMMKTSSGYVSPDLDYVNKVDANVFTKCTYMFKTPAAPFVSAQVENKLIDINMILRDYKLLKESCDFVIVEGIGGISVPITPSLTIKDLIKILDLPVLIVARPDLGTINHSILTVEYAYKYNIDLLGIVISGYPEGSTDAAIKSAPDVICNFSQQEILGVIPKIKGLSHENPQAELLIEAIIRHINLEKVFRVKLPKLSDVIS
ncbi:MAG: dethiobiotin synthase [Cyanobacteriota bacterium]